MIMVLMTFALLGVFVMQLYYIRESYKLKSELFDENVNSAIAAVVNKVQKRNAFVFINKKDTEIQEKKAHDIKSRTDSIVAFKLKFKESETLRKLKQEQEIMDYLNFQEGEIRANFISPIILSEEQYRLYSSNQNPQEIGLGIEDYRDKKSGKLLGRKVTPFGPQVKLNMLMDRLPDTIRYLAYSPVDMFPKLISLPSQDPDLIAKFKIEDAKAERKYQMGLKRLYGDTLDLYPDESLALLKDVASEMSDPNIPLKQRVPSKEFLDTLIKKELLNKNISIPYHYWITPVKNKKDIIYQNAAYQPEGVLAKDTYEHSLFSNDLIRDPGMLYIRFPDKNSAIMENLFATMASSAALLLVLIFIFSYTIFAILRQKKLSEMKTDFINNMTHEFKTPVATIMIASEALKDPEVVSDSGRINRLAGIIYDENVRLGNHIERVLNVARLEKNEIRLDKAPVDMNELVSAVLDSMELQLRKREAEVLVHLDAHPAVVMGDELHLSNVIYNLVDNANKYSADSPKISISTRNTSRHLVLTVSDQGIGMSKEQTKRIFDQFYRVPTGNLHDVKGFGLGLNYVRDIIHKMGGSIKVHSEKDKGTTFEMTIPFKHNH